MYDIDNCIRKEGQENSHREQIENSFDVPRELLGFVGGHTSSSLREWTPSRAEVLRFMLAGFLRSDGSISHEGDDKEDKKEDWVRGAQVFQQLKGCMGIHCPLNIPEMSVSNKVHDRVLPRKKGKKGSRVRIGKDWTTGMAKDRHEEWENFQGWMAENNLSRFSHVEILERSKL